MTENNETKNWEYNGYHELYDMSGEIELEGNIVKVHDLYNGTPEFLKKADAIFVDPPWNIGNVNTFYTKADKENEHKQDFIEFLDMIFDRIDDINPDLLFLEIGKQYLADVIKRCEDRFKYVTFYNNTYYHKKDNLCYIVHATNTYKKSKLKEIEGIDEEDAIKLICKNAEFDCIADICMGLGTLGIEAYKHGRSFVGTELNGKRLANLVHFIKTNPKQSNISN